MFTRVLSLFALVLGTFFASAALANEAEKPWIAQTIQSQLGALIIDDFEQAFGYASPMIQGIFGSPERFGTMVAQGYPMVHRPAEVRFLELREIAGVLYQKVQISDAKGHIHFLDYQMIAGENGWKINGVQLLKAAGLSA